jgi:hypothetical protein
LILGYHYPGRGSDALFVTLVAGIVVVVLAIAVLGYLIGYPVLRVTRLQETQPPLVRPWKTDLLWFFCALVVAAFYADVVVRQLVRDVVFGARAVTTAAPSPDGEQVAELVDRRLSFGDRNFTVRLKSRWLGIVPWYRHMFESPDEQPSEGTERFLWSKDGRYLLLLGKDFLVVRPEACLASGEWLYLLVDTTTNAVSSRATIKDIAGTDFGESLQPGITVVERTRAGVRKERCAPKEPA